MIEANPAASAMHGYAREAFIGLLPPAFIHPDSQHQFADFTQELRSGTVLEALVQHVRRDGSTFHAEWCGTAFTLLGRPCILGAVRDVRLSLQAEHRLQQQVEARTREQSALLDISHALASTLELQPGLILDRLQGIVEYTHAGLFGLANSTLTALAVRGAEQLERAVPSRSTWRVRRRWQACSITIARSASPTSAAMIRRRRFSAHC